MSEAGVIYLQKDKFDFYTPLLGKIIEFRFVPEIVKDLDVINPELFEDLIKLFIANNKIPACGITMILADNASFIKDFLLTDIPPQLPEQTPNQENSVVSIPRLTPEVLKEQVGFFLEHVPFDDVASETYSLSNGTKVWATNRELYETIAGAFEKQGFQIKAVLPGLVFEGNIGSKEILDIAMSNMVLQKFDSLRQHNLLTEKQIEPQIKENTENKQVKKNEVAQEIIDTTDQPKPGTNKKRLVLLVIVFVLLIGVLVVLFITQKPLG